MTCSATAAPCILLRSELYVPQALDLRPPPFGDLQAGRLTRRGSSCC